MSNYKRLISYIYAYEGGVKGKNVGYAKIEVRGVQCKIGVSIKKVYVGNSDIGVYLLTSQKEIYLGNIFIRNGSGEFRGVCSAANIEGQGLSMDQCYGLTIHEVENAWQAYTTIWEDAVAHAAEIELADVTSANRLLQNEKELECQSERTEASPEMTLQAEAVENLEPQMAAEEAVQEETVPASAQIEPMPREEWSGGEWRKGLGGDRREGRGEDWGEGHRDDREERRGEDWRDERGDGWREGPEEPWRDGYEEDGVEERRDDLEDDFEERSIHRERYRRGDHPRVLEVAKQSTPEPGDPEELAELARQELEETNPNDVWDGFQRGYPKLLAFDYENGCEILSIHPQDLGLLPREVWVYGNNSFLLHGFYNYRYLILAKLNNPNGRSRYLLGVPGHYYSNEKYMASMFGFPNFVLAKQQPQQDGRFGYWYTDIRI